MGHADSTFRVLTGSNPAGIAIIGLRGPLVPALVAGRMSRAAEVDTLRYVTLRDERGDPLDDPIVWRRGAEEAELSVHGGPEVVRQVSQTLRDFGFVEGLESGGLDRFWPACRTERAARELLAAIGRGESELCALLRWLLHVPTVAVIGLPNVGKSTLVNALAGHEASITADLPGTTRDYVGAEADVGPHLGGFLVRLLDTPGRQQATDAIEARAIELAETAAGEADALIIVGDGSRGPTLEEQDLLRELRVHPKTLVVANRCDVGTGNGWPDQTLRVSARTGLGLAELRDSLCQMFGVREG